MQIVGMKIKFNHLVKTLSALAVGSAAFTVAISTDLFGTKDTSLKKLFTTACVAGGQGFGEKSGDVMMVAIYPRGNQSISGRHNELSGLDYDVLAVAPRSMYGRESDSEQGLVEDLYAYTYYGEGAVIESAGPLAILSVDEPKGSCKLHFAFKPSKNSEVVSASLTAKIYGALDR